MKVTKVKNASEYKTKLFIDFFSRVNQHPAFSKYIFRVLYNYQYLFLFPKSYLSYHGKHDMQINRQIMQSFTNTSLKKRFNILEFTDRFQNTPNQTKAYIKNLIIKVFQVLLYHKLS